MSARSSATSAATTSITVSPISTVDTQTSATEVRYHTVKAGAGGFHFEPAELANVSVGDVVTFEFYPPDHSVARAEFGSACVPYEYTGRDRTGFWSETQWVETPSNSTAQSQSFITAPPQIRAKGSRWSASFNPNATQTLDDQILAAARADYQLAPGDRVPNEASSAFVSPLTVSSQADLVSANKPPPKLSTAGIAGITVGAILLLVLCTGVLFFLARKACTGRQTAPWLHSQTGHNSKQQVEKPPVQLPVSKRQFISSSAI
ncbi:hypothetical protein COCC4DRAFT_42182 [Bipolaris maydis ATCC 48331]|uniref:Uncharacterized protein n=1 Tax=Cochliobolus heterostrophus (strain C4 / ATCC 48331 / race T) TaxID=665024 RepID=N4WUJ7_COCH4|nr:uncharacterized protein COCC4DRAFT_42182 [Bipolaris maydis ATCC 48331]KAJ5047753.1 hypothetical protein J3E74DRAFT_412561 [Bipolaris maydis]ENI03115.1 hypothetical protein COCC4DRAFT_42182 [Bipolaris maydis ATCC 48331]KAJ5052548.1 hypothetical protein J3E74DRAFT_412069 [Bipolaris maydis]KAJ6192228.1 hypothetical protein J3E72DRAFT_380011 [Bipolaris maydis]KAJ6203695.1 hypothetical protein PSV09DRAFT_2405280 [Bipolaris maydis]